MLNQNPLSYKACQEAMRKLKKKLLSIQALGGKEGKFDNEDFMKTPSGEQRGIVFSNKNRYYYVN